MMGKRKASSPGQPQVLVSTFSKVMSLTEAEKEQKKKTSTGEALREADREYARRRR